MACLAPTGRRVPKVAKDNAVSRQREPADLDLREEVQVTAS